MKRIRIDAKTTRKVASVPEQATCPYRGDHTRTITHATCKNRTINVEVYSCGLFGGECVHRKYCTDHDPALRVCVGCPRE